ncbi:MAG: cupin-like domain-containing protein, partial [Rhodanobacter sp.]
MSTAIDEYPATARAPGLDDIVGSDRPVVIRNLAKNWPLVRLAGESDTAFAKGLAAFDNGSDVDALLMPAEEEGIVGYNADFDAFNYAHHRVSITQGLQRLAHYSRQDNPPGLAMQSALIAACLPGLLHDHALSFLDPKVQPRIWIG